MGEIKTAAPETVRIKWVDSARGLCVIAVVLFHVTIWHYLKFEHENSIAFTAWDGMAKGLGAVRMPLLLALSGMLAASKIRHGFTGKAFPSALSNFYLYAVWLVVYALLSIPVAESNLPHRVESLGDFALQMVAPDTPLWFVLALAVYTLALAAARKAPAALVIAATAALSIAVAVIPGSESGQWWKVPEMAVFFTLGVYGKEALMLIGGPKRVTALASALPAFAVLTAASTLFDAYPAIDQVFLILRGVAAVVVLVSVVSLLMRSRVIAFAGSWVGRRTLGVYVLHTPVIFAVLLAFQGPLAPIAGIVAASVPIAFLYPAALTLIVVAACVVIENLLKRCGFTFLFRRPGSFRAK